MSNAENAPAPSGGPSQELKEQEVVLVSACLLGAACRYDGKAKHLPALEALLAGKAVVPICPEAAAGLGTPRPAVQLRGGTGASVWTGEARARTVDGGEDHTQAFLDGAKHAVRAAETFGARFAVLKQRSPSCGSREVWVDGALVEGEGITTALLRRRGVTVVGEDALPAPLLEERQD